MLYDLVIGTHYLVWIFVILVLLALDLAVVVHVLLNKHDEPASALLWIFIILDFHIIGIFFYLFLGVNRVKTVGQEIKDAQEELQSERDKPGGVFARFLESRARHIAPDSGFKLAECSRVLNQRVLAETVRGMRKEGRIAKKSVEDLRTNQSEANQRIYADAIERIETLYPVLSGNRLQLLEDGTTAYPRMIKAIESATDHIHLQSYIIMNDAFGKRLFEILERKARDGVAVKVIFDRLGSGVACGSIIRNYGRLGIPKLEIKVFSGLLKGLLAPWRVQLRNHRKLLLIDGRKAFVGGINISAENVETVNKQSLETNKYIHDLHCEIEGPVVGEFQYSFLNDWSYVIGESAQKLISPGHFPEPEKKGEALVRVSASGPGQNYENTKKLFMTATTVARKSIWIITPYFVPDKPFIDALCMAAARGVEVRVVIPRNNNHWYVRYACSSFYNTLLEAGARVFEKKGMFSHVKAMLVDETWAAMGSSNCDNRSFRLNYELDFLVQDPEFIQTLKNQFLAEMRQSEEINLFKRLSRSFREELLEDFCCLLTPIL